MQVVGCCYYYIVIFRNTHWAFVKREFGVILVSLKNLQCLYQKRTSLLPTFRPNARCQGQYELK